jgi:hypothetical protein
MAPYLIIAVGLNGHFVSVKEIMASSDAAALNRARQLLDRFDLEVWSGGRKIGELSAHRRTPWFPTLWRRWLSFVTPYALSLSQSGECELVRIRAPGPLLRSHWASSAGDTT